MDPRISNLTEENGILKFTLTECNMSIANALRRIIVSDIPTFVFRTYPYSENKAEIRHNTTRLHNEIIKQRLSCIPINIQDMNFPYKDYVIELDIKNETDNIIYVTTKDFKIKNIVTEHYSSESEVRQIFPPCPITHDYIEFARLQPKLSENIDGERLALRCALDIGTAGQDGSFNVTSTCAYECTPDIEKANQAWAEKEKAFKKEKMSEEDIEFEKKNWFILEAKRFYVENSYDFVIESVGVFDNMEILTKACDIMIKKCESFMYDLEHGNVVIVTSETTLKNGFDITLKNEDYTLGKVIEFYLYQNNFIGDKSVSFCGFRKPHPHSVDSLIRIAFHNPIEVVGVSGYLQGATDNAIQAYKQIMTQLGGNIQKSMSKSVSKSMSGTEKKSSESPKKYESKQEDKSLALAPASASAAAAAAPASKKLSKLPTALASSKPSGKLDLSKLKQFSVASSASKADRSVSSGDEDEN
jgi:DNA-directed RNA polymerase subunit L